MKRKILLCISLVLSVITFYGLKPVHADLSSCTTSVTPNAITRSTTDNFFFTVHNTSSTEISWIKITRPSAHFDLENTTVNGWSANTTTSEVILTEGTLAPSGSVQITISATSSSTEVSGVNWTVEASDDSNGAGAISCDGGLEAEISGEPSDNTEPTLSSITISDISDTSVVISWTTDEASDAEIFYSSDGSFDLHAQDTDLSTSHSITISGLTANTTYNFRINSTDEAGNTGQSSDSTFTTAKVGSTSQTVTVTVTTTKTITPTPTPTPIPDRTPPTILVTTIFDKPFKTPPLVKGQARDVKGVVQVEYSIDGGKNWLAVDSITTQATTVPFDFTPPPLDDDNYQVKVRAKDTSGNIGMSSELTMIIDRLPPGVGASISSIGPQLLLGKNGMLYGLEGLEQKITLSAVGGPISIDIISGNLSFPLTKNKDNGLWSGMISFDRPGTYPIIAKSIDGADNKTERELNSIVVLPRGTITSNSIVVTGSRITVFVKDFTTNQFVKWDGISYGQANPQLSKDGTYGLLLPPGTYYIEIVSDNYKTLRTTIFTLTDSLPINNNFILTPKRFFQIGPFRIPLPDFTVESTAMNLPEFRISQSSAHSNLIDKPLPEATVQEGDKSIASDSLAGKPTVITVLNSWDPNSSSQIAILERVFKDGVPVVALFEQETPSKISIFKKRGGYTIPMLTDRDGVLVEPLMIHSLPMHLFMDRKGIIKKIQFGILDEVEVRENLLN